MPIRDKDARRAYDKARRNTPSHRLKEAKYQRERYQKNTDRERWKRQNLAYGHCVTAALSLPG